MAQDYFAKHMLTLQQMANLNLRARELSMGAMKDRSNRSKYRKSRSQALADKENIAKKIDTYRN